MLIEQLLILLRGLFKSIPVGNPVSEIWQNLVQMKENSSGTAAVKPLPHKWLSIAAQLVGLGVIAYSMFTHNGTVNQIIKTVTAGTPLDSLIKQ